MEITESGKLGLDGRMDVIDAHALTQSDEILGVPFRFQIAAGIADGVVTDVAVVVSHVMCLSRLFLIDSRSLSPRLISISSSRHAEANKMKNLR